MKTLIALVVIFAVTTQAVSAQIQRGGRGGGGRVNVQNHSTGYNGGGSHNYNNNANVNRNYNNNANVNRNYNNNTNVNVNRNVNVNSNVNYHGGYYGGCCYNEGSNWGAFAAGAAVGTVTTAAVAAATRPSTTVVTNTVVVGSVVPALPGGCATIANGSAVVYQCSNVYYRPYYQGSQLVYQVVTYP
jgi:hypothetical protein